MTIVIGAKLLLYTFLLPRARELILLAPLLPYLYYLFAAGCARRFFGKASVSKDEFTPSISILKPVRGVDHEAYENFATFCRLDYPDYEILFGVCDAQDPVIAIIQKLIADFPDRSIRLFSGLAPTGPNEKASILAHLARRARHEILMVSDSDTRVTPNCLRVIAARFRDPAVGAVTCLYRGIGVKTFGGVMEAFSISADFLPSVLVARQIGGMRFALGATFATTRQRMEEIGGFEMLSGYLLDDFEVGHLISASGYRVELLPYVVSIVLSAENFWSYWQRQIRWLVGIRHAQPWGHLGMLGTQGLPLTLLAVAACRSIREAGFYAAAYLVTRYAMAWFVGVWGLQDSTLSKKWWLLPVTDVVRFFAWMASFKAARVTWRGNTFQVRSRQLWPERATPDRSL